MIGRVGVQAQVAVVGVAHTAFEFGAVWPEACDSLRPRLAEGSPPPFIAGAARATASPQPGNRPRKGRMLAGQPCTARPQRPSPAGGRRTGRCRVEELQVDAVDGELGGLARPDAERADTRAVHTDLPPASAVTLVVVLAAAAASLMLACWTGGASIVKITWISVPSSSVTPAVTGSRGQPLSARLASSKFDGRMPRMILRPKSRRVPAWRRRRRGHWQPVPGEADQRPVVADELGHYEVHRRRADEPGDEQVDRRVEQGLRRVDLLQPTVPQHATRWPSVIASTWSWVT